MNHPIEVNPCLISNSINKDLPSKTQKLKQYDG